MTDLIAALYIFLRYGDPHSPTHCEHDVMFVNIDPALVSDADKTRLEELGFTPDGEFEMFSSFRYGSC